MDRTEKIAAEFLKSLGHSSTYEPDGNVPPDFVTSDGTAVEVRRLNQVYFDHNGKVQGLENADMALWQTIPELIAGYQTSAELENTIGVFYMFGRPLPKKRAIARELKIALDAFLEGDRDFSQRVTLPCGIRLRFFDYRKWMGTPFRHSGAMDDQSGGWVVGKLATSLSHALTEKETKVLPFKAKYHKWWLILVDHVSWGTDENDRRQLRLTGPFRHTFDKVYIVNPENIEDYFEL
jgi:hypothetical protein